MRLFALKGIEALSASTRIVVIYSLLYDSDTRVRAVARKELLTLPLETLQAYLEENPHPKVLDFLIRNIPKNSPALSLLASAPNLSHRTKNFLKSQGITLQPKPQSIRIEVGKNKASEEKPLEIDLEWKPDAEDFDLPEGVEFSMPTQDDEPELTLMTKADGVEKEEKASLEDTTPVFEFNKQVSSESLNAPEKEEKFEPRTQIETIPSQAVISNNTTEVKTEEFSPASEKNDEEEEAPQIGGVEEEMNIEWKPVFTFKTTPTGVEELFPVRDEKKAIPRTKPVLSKPIQKIQPTLTPSTPKVREQKSYFFKGILIGSAISVLLVLIFIFISKGIPIFHPRTATPNSQLSKTQSGADSSTDNAQTPVPSEEVKTVDILLGSYTSAGKAEQARQKVEALGLRVVVSQKTDEKTLWVVSSSNPEARGYCGSYSSEADARKCALALKSAGYPAGVSKVSKRIISYTVKVKNIPQDKVEETLETLKSAGFKPRII